jgi:hypothetical protein
MPGVMGNSRNVQRAICLALAAVIVSMSLTFGAYAATRATHPGYSITITQLS